LRKIEIKRNTNGDTRVAKEIPNFYKFKESNTSHRRDVCRMMLEIAEDIKSAGMNHDYTKTEDDTGSLFYREFCNTLDGKMNFEEGQWYKMHCKKERHHLNKHCPEDVNLIDVIEMICDCVCAGMARSGSVYPIEISSEILQKAVKNTAEMCMSCVQLIGD